MKHPLLLGEELLDPPWQNLKNGMDFYNKLIISSLQTFNCSLYYKSESLTVRVEIFLIRNSD